MLKSSKIFFSLFFVFLSFTQLKGEEKIDIWKNDKKQKTISEENKNFKLKIKDNQNLQETSKILSEEKISIEQGSSITSNEVKIYGVYDPQDFNFNLNMWSLTKAEDVRASIKRLKKIKLSRTSNDILEKVLMSFSYPPEGMSEKEFANLKINWLIENNRSNLIENFLKQNKEFEGKSRAVQYLVDEKITEANIKEGCEKIKFIDSTIKDAYLEKFKIYCLVFNNKKSEAQLLLDLLREQKQSDKFFDDKIDYLLGISDKTSKKINEKNLLNFYLSSVTIENFNYQPNVNTKKEIWKYLNAANLIKLEDISDKKRIEELEIAANKGQIDEKIIFAIYKQIPFNLNTLVNAKSVYQTLNKTDARSLIYQKYLLSENVDSKLEYLFLLDDLFKKDKKTYIFSKFLSDSLKQIGVDNIPESYKEISQKKILSDEEIELGKVKYNDKILHQSKIIKFYLEKEEEKKTQKDINRIFKKISKNKKYFYSAKDIALTESLVKDGFKIPSNFNYVEIAEKYEVPKNLLQLIKNEQNAFLILKIVEIIGEDEPHQLDPETIYFITNLLNETGLKKIRNKVLISALPQRV
tara:strand:+ start:185 stop:1924 length:1740 start_codon:yes stop_codon:yes gene_type:complete